MATELPTPEVKEIPTEVKSDEQIKGEAFANEYNALCKKHDLMIAPSLNVVPMTPNVQE